MSVPSSTIWVNPSRAAFRNARASLGERADSSMMVSSTYLQAVVADTPNLALISANVSSLRN
ncbi:hypothetical protein GCM10022254_75440 [Actinomadura meridiana]|uniref:Uncharacterized protein n=1 Tax=Actinomadura meridiana TaxID=559626 RepID=A0ABP8CRE7_9ACTN